MKLRGKYRDFPHSPCFHTCIAPLIVNASHQSGAFATTDEPILTQHHHPSPQFTLRFTLCVVHSTSLDKCIHHCSSIQNSFITLKILCSTYSSLLLPQPLATTDLFIIRIVLPFTECHTIGIIQYVAFQIGFFHLVT